MPMKMCFKRINKMSKTCCVLIIETVDKTGQNAVLVKKKDFDNRLCNDY